MTEFLYHGQNFYITDRIFISRTEFEYHRQNQSRISDWLTKGVFRDYFDYSWLFMTIHCFMTIHDYSWLTWVSDHQNMRFYSFFWLNRIFWWSLTWVLWGFDSKIRSLMEAMLFFFWVIVVFFLTWRNKTDKIKKKFDD